MNRPTDKQIEEVLAGVATPEDAKFVAEWFATEEGNTYLDAVMTREAEYLKAETAEIYVDHTIPSEKMYHQIQKNISRKQIKRICFRVAAILIPVIFLIGLYLQINSRVDLFGTTEYEEIRVAKGERIQMMFQDGTRVYINSDSWLKYPKKFGLSKREVFLVGEAYFVVAKNKKRPFIVNLNGPSVHVLGTSFDVQAYPENKDIVICLDEGHVNLTLSSAKKYPLLPGEKLIYNKESDQCRIIKNDHSKHKSKNEFSLAPAVARIDNLGNVAAVHKVFEYGKLLLLAAGNGKLPILRDNGEIIILPFSVLLIVGRRVRKANQMPDTPGHKVAAALKISAALFIRAKYGGNRRPDARFLCNYKFHTSSSSCSVSNSSSSSSSKSRSSRLLLPFAASFLGFIILK